MDSDSITISSFLKTINIQFKHHQNETIKKITEKFINAQPVNLTLKETTTLSKLQNEQSEPYGYPLMYLLWRDIYNDGEHRDYFRDVPNLMNYNLFTQWYRTHQHLINMDKVFSNASSEYVKIMEDRKAIYANNLISLEIQYQTETNDMLLEHFEGNYISIDLYSFNGVPKPDLNLVTKIVEFMRSLSSNTKKHVTIIILCGTAKKSLPPALEVVCPDNTNSGLSSTTDCMDAQSCNGSYIFLWRIEELYKVLIHELIHYFRLDFNMTDDIYHDFTKYTETTFLVNENDKPNEAYTEFNAVVLHSVVFSQLLQMDFNDVINDEIKFSLFQVAKLLVFYGADTLNQIYQTNPTHVEIKQTTSIFSYFFLKTFILLSFASIIGTNKVNYINVIKHNIPKITKAIDYLIQCVKDCIRANDDPFIMNTMRMTCYSKKLNN